MRVGFLAYMAIALSTVQAAAIPDANESHHGRRRGGSSGVPSFRGGHQSGDATPSSPWIIRSLPFTKASATLPPISSPYRPDARHRINDKFENLAVGLVDWIPAAMIILASGGLARWLYTRRRRYRNGLLAGAGVAGGVCLLVHSDKETPFALLVAVSIGYGAFHAAYFGAATKYLNANATEVSAAGTTIAAVFVFLATGQIPTLVQLWKDSTGIGGLWSFLPIHLCTLFLSCIARKITRGYNRAGANEEDEQELDPIFQSAERFSVDPHDVAARPATCLCQQYSVCGCDEDDPDSATIGYRDLNTSLPPASTDAQGSMVINTTQTQTADTDTNGAAHGPREERASLGENGQNRVQCVTRL